MSKSKSKKSAEASKKSENAAASQTSVSKVVKLKKLTKKEVAFARGVSLIKDPFIRFAEGERPTASWMGASALASAFGRKKVGKKSFKKIAKGLASPGYFPIHIFEHNLSKTSKGFGLVSLDAVMDRHLYAVGDPDHKNRVDHMHMQSAAEDSVVKAA